MKKTIVLLLLLLLFIPVYVISQIPTLVNDPTNLAKIGEVLEAGKTQIKKIQEQTKLFKDAQDKYKTVNREFEKVKAFKNAINQQTNLLKYFTNDLTKVSKNPVSDKAYLTYLKTIDTYRSQILDNNNLLLQLLTDNVFQMSDYERLKAVNELIGENNNILEKAQREKKYYEDMNTQLQILMNLKKK